MAHGLIFLLSWLPAAAFAQLRFDCAQSASPKLYADYIKREYTRRDVSIYVEYVKHCDKSNPPLISDRQARSYIEMGRVAEAERRIKAADAASNYRDVSKDVDKIQALLKDTRAEGREKHLQRIRQRGLKNQGQEARYCSPVDLREKFGEVRNQDSVGWCYAFAAADMLSFKTGVRVSATDIAVNHTAQEKSHLKRVMTGKGELDLSERGGYPYFALEQSIKRGVCRESDSPSEFFGNNTDIKDYIKKLEDSAEKSWGRYLYNNLRRSPTSDCNPLQKQLSRTYEVVQKSLPTNVMYKLNEARCEGRRIPVKVPGLNWAGYGDKSHSKMRIINFIDHYLSHNMPVVADYDAAIFAHAPQQGAHASVIVGRRFNKETNKCEFLIRNSWGKSCAYYGSRHQCEDGNIWVPREEFHQHVTGVTGYAKN